MSHLEISLPKYLYLRKRLAKSATMFHLEMGSISARYGVTDLAKICIRKE